MKILSPVALASNALENCVTFVVMFGFEGVVGEWVGGVWRERI